MKFIRKINIDNQYIKYQIPFFKMTYLIKWFPRSKTRIHGHKGKDCDFIPLWGDITLVEGTQVIGYLVVDLPKDVTISRLRWIASDTVTINY